MVATQPAKPNIQDLAARLWETADELRANSHLKAAEYSIPVLGLIFLKFADSRFTALEGELKGKATGRREIGKRTTRPEASCISRSRPASTSCSCWSGRVVVANAIRRL